jgi:predicted metalloprotease with PDZ domain
MSRSVRTALLGVVFAGVCSVAFAQAPVSYRLSFPEPHHRWMQVEIEFRDVLPAPLDLQMSRSSPGRYALHEFAKNVFDVTVTDAEGRPLAVSRPNPHQWRVEAPGGAVRVRYRVFGDRVDGTYLAVDSTHAHINMPSALMWARGLEERPATVRFEPPAGTEWRVATQLFPGADAWTFAAPNLQYLMDSPTEFGAFELRTFTVTDGRSTPTIRIAMHHDGSDAELDAFAADVEKMVRASRTVFGEYAPFENNTYTFIADYLPWANGDGMEHRNSTILTSAASLRTQRDDLLGTVSHEFFHSWNVERIRPRTLEPFNFADTNMTGELWLAEGFTNYYGPLILRRAGLLSDADFAAEMGGQINTVLTAPGRQVRTLEEMSRFAPFVDAAAAIDRTSFDNTFISYYTWGASVGIGLDLALRERSNGAVTLDHFMRRLWEDFGKPGGRAPGYVERPYTIDDVRNTLATVAGDRAFAEDFIARYIQGHEVVDYAGLLAQAGFMLRPANPGAGFIGQLRFQDGTGGVRLVAAAPFGSPAYQAGLDRDDLILSVDGRQVRTAAELDGLVRGQRPGATLPIAFERRGRRVTASITVIADPRQQMVTVESAGQPLTDAQRRFRDAWFRGE